MYITASSPRASCTMTLFEKLCALPLVSSTLLLWGGTLLLFQLQLELTFTSIIGRMSKDLYLIDLMLPIQLLSFFRLVVGLLAVFAMLCFGSYYLVIAIVPLIGLYQFLQMYYRRTSIEVQRLESLSRAPIFSHFSETLCKILY